MKPIPALVTAFLSLLALLQLTRVVLHWQVMVNGVDIPLWASGVACVVTGGLAFLLWRDARR